MFGTHAKGTMLAPHLWGGLRGELTSGGARVRVPPLACGVCAHAHYRVGRWQMVAAACE